MARGLRLGFHQRPYVLQASPVVYNYYPTPTLKSGQGAGSNMLTQGQPFTVQGTGFGSQSLLASLDDTGADAAVGSISPQWSAHYPYASALPNVNIQNQPIGFSGPAGSAIGAPHPYITNITAGSHDGADFTNGQDVGLLWQFTTLPLPCVFYASFYQRADPGWAFNGQNGITFGDGDNNYKYFSYGAGAGIYTNQEWYLNGAFNEWNSNTVLSGQIGWNDATGFPTGQSLIDPDAAGHANDFPSSGDPGTPNTLSPFHAATGWIKSEIEVLLTATNALVSAGGGYINQYDDGVLTLFYQGSTDGYGTGTSAIRTFLLGGYTRDYTAAAVPATPHAAANNVRYFADMHMRVTTASSSFLNVPRVEVGNNPVWANCTIREPQTNSTWTGTNIGIPAFNKGRLPGGQTAYVFVRTSAGAIVIPTNIPSATVSVSP